MPNFSNSFFNIEYVDDKSNAPTGTSSVKVNKYTFEDLRDVWRSYPKNCMAAHLNLNSLLYKFYGSLNIISLRYKYYEITVVLTDNIVDLFIISLTKLDESFNVNLFSVDGYTMQVESALEQKQIFKFHVYRCKLNFLPYLFLVISWKTLSCVIETNV